MEGISITHLFQQGKGMQNQIICLPSYATKPDKKVNVSHQEWDNAKSENVPKDSTLCKQGQTYFIQNIVELS